MHVLWVPSWFPTDSHPHAGTFFAEQVQMLINHGLQCGVVYVEATSLGTKRIATTVKQEPFPLIHTGFTLIPKGILPIEGKLLTRLSRKIAKQYEAQFGKPDIVHAHSVWPGVVVAQALAQYWQVPYGVTEHRPSSVEANKKTSRGRLIQASVSKADFAITVSTRMTELFSEYYDFPRVDTIALPVNDAFLTAEKSSPLEKPFTFLHISNLDDNKRTVFTINTFKKHLESFPDSKLLIVGGNPLRVEELKNLVSDLGMQTSIEFTGQVKRDQIITTMLRGDCLILVSEKEAGGTVFAEAAALGIPAIASSTYAGEFMVTSDTGIVIPIDAKADLLNAMSRVVHSADTDLFNSEKIRRIARERFSENTFANQHIAVYSRSLGSHPLNR